MRVKLFFRIFEPTVLILRKLLDRGVCFGVARASLPAGLLALLGASGSIPRSASETLRLARRTAKLVGTSALLSGSQ